MRLTYIFVIALGFVAFLHLTHGVKVNVNTSKAPALKDFGRRVKNTLEKWFPKIKKQLNTPAFQPIPKINIFFDPNYGGVAYASGNRIIGSVNYYKQNKDLGSMVHELVHVIQQHKNCPGWITEGLADWIRYWRFQPKKKPGKPGPGSHYTQGYGVAAYFLNWIHQRHKPFNKWLHKDCRAGNYNQNIFKRLTGKGLDQLWSTMMSRSLEEIEMDENQSLDDSFFDLSSMPNGYHDVDVDDFDANDISWADESFDYDYNARNMNMNATILDLFPKRPEDESPIKYS